MQTKDTVTFIEIKNFWKWFSEHQNTLKSIMAGEHQKIDLILNELIIVKRGLAVEFERLNDNTIGMTVSADGIEDNFPFVKQIIDNAPQIEGWRFIAFRQPVSNDKFDGLSVSVDERIVNAKDIHFLPIEDEGHLYIQVFSELITTENEKQLGYGILMLLDNIIGEYNCVKRVYGFEFYNLTEAKDFMDDLQPLTELPNFLSQYYNN
jgi:hypothetical protein